MAYLFMLYDVHKLYNVKHNGKMMIRSEQIETWRDMEVPCIMVLFQHTTFLFYPPCLYTHTVDRLYTVYLTIFLTHVT